MKRSLVAILALVVIFSLAACDGKMATGMACGMPFPVLPLRSAAATAPSCCGRRSQTRIICSVHRMMTVGTAWNDA